MPKQRTVAELLHAVATIAIWLRVPDTEISSVQVIKSSRAIDELMEELRRHLNSVQ